MSTYTGCIYSLGPRCTMYFTVHHGQRALKTSSFLMGKGDWGIHAVAEATKST